MKKNLIIVVIILFSTFLYSQNSPQQQIENSNWVATDALGRTIETYQTVGETKPNKYVGVFYYIWHGNHGDKLFDATKLIAANPQNPEWGPKGVFHHWGESEAGYYKAIDKWAIRRNMQMLTNAGVDFIYIDMTNSLPYLSTMDTLCKIMLQMRSEGMQTPYFVCTLHSNSEKTANTLYQSIYSQNKYKDLWFYWDGKPLLLCDLDTLNKTKKKVISKIKYSLDVLNFFTMKHCWAWSDQKLPNSWQWLDKYPQDYGWSINSDDHEQLAVSVASHPNNFKGDSYSNNSEPPINQYCLTEYTGQGRHFAEQWKRVFELSPTPSVVMVTQWNEWMSQKQVVEPGKFATFLGKKISEGSPYFVDTYNQEFNRDMEPMKGGHTDNKYYQLVTNVRKFKGMEKPEMASEPKIIEIDGKFDEWKDVKPIFTDPRGDTYHRNEVGYEKGTIYKNNTGRNDIVESRVAIDSKNVYFYAKTVDKLTSFTDKNWMLCFIDADKNVSTGWQGFDFAVGIDTKNENQLSLSTWKKDNWKTIASVEYKYSDNQLEIAIPLKIIEIKLKNTNFNFQWADNIQKLDDITEFFIHGDVAPDRRFRYNYKIE